LHIHYDHQCPTCNAYYIPYDVDVPCPSCGLLEQERFDFISQAVASARFNFKAKDPVPTAWFAGSLADHILWLPVFWKSRGKSRMRSLSMVWLTSCLDIWNGETRRTFGIMSAP
jgi:hypothetical protein